MVDSLACNHVRAASARLSRPHIALGASAATKIALLVEVTPTTPTPVFMETPTPTAVVKGLMR